MDDLVDSAIDAIGDHLGQVGVHQAGRIADHAVDDLYRLVAHRLSRTPTGTRVLGVLQQQPAAPAARQQVRDVLRDEVQADARFSQALQEAAHWAAVTGPAPRAPGATYGNTSTWGSGNVTAQAGRDAVGAGRDVKIKKYQIGSIRFGTGGLLGGVVLLLALVGGGTAAVFSTVVDLPQDRLLGLRSGDTPCSDTAAPTGVFHPVANDRLLERARGCSGGLTLTVDHVTEEGGVVSLDMTAHVSDSDSFGDLAVLSPSDCTLTDDQGNTLKADVFASTNWSAGLPHDGKDHRGRLTFETNTKLSSTSTVASLTFLHVRLAMTGGDLTVENIKLGPTKS